jgi:long-chain fatty acid transport protein
VELGIFDWQESSHTDTFGNYRKHSKIDGGAYGNAAYARHAENSACAYGVALVVQGGIGWQYSGLNTAFGTRDDAAATFTVIKLAPAFAWEVNDQLSLGVALGINYVAANQELFPNTPAFPGFRFKDASGIGLSSKWGLQYRPVKDMTIGVTYGPQTSVPLKGGTLRINVPGQGIVRYDNAKLNGNRLPEELALGIAFRPTTSLLVSLHDHYRITTTQRHRAAGTDHFLSGEFS